MNEYRNDAELKIEKTLMFNNKTFKEEDIVEIEYLYEYSKGKDTYKEVRKTIAGRIINLEERSLKIDASKDMNAMINIVLYRTIYSINKKTIEHVNNDK